MKRIIITTLVFCVTVLIQEVSAVMTFDTNEIVVTASRIAQHGYRVSSNVTVIDRDEIEASNAKTVSEILQYTMGVNVYDNSTAKTAVIDIRGFGDTASRNILVLVNDRKVNQIDISTPDTLQISLDSVERIEVIRGGGSVLYGDNAVGGVVNIITRKGEGKLKGKVDGSYGSYDSSKYGVEVSGAQEDFSYLIFANQSNTDGYRSNSAVHTSDYAGRFSYDFSDILSVDLNTAYHRDHYGLPGGLNFTELETLGRRGSADAADYADTKDRFIELSLDMTPWPEDIDLGHFIVDFSYRNRDTYATFAAFDFNTKNSIDTYGVNAKYIYDQTLFDKELNVVLGLDFYDTNHDILGSGSNGDDLTISKRELGSYLFTEYELLDNLFLNAGTRFHEADYVFDQKKTVESFDTESPSESVNLVGMKYEYAEGSHAFFKVQQTFRFLSTSEWYSTFTGILNLDLKQQRGLEYEVGLQHNLNDTTIISVTPYWMDITNEIFLNPEAGFFGSNDNYDKTRRIGVEVGQKTDLLRLFDVEFLNKFEIFTNYTFQDPEFVDGDNNGKQIPFTSEHQASFGMNLEFLENFGATFSGRYVGSRFAINDTANETPRVKPYFVVDGKLTYKKPNWEIFAALNNMFDEEYFAFVSKATTSTVKDHFPAAERNYAVGMKLKF